MKRGEIYLCDLGDPMGHEASARRPVVVVSHDELAGYGLPIVVPVTRTRRGYATHVELEDVLPVTSYAQCEQIRAVSHERLVRYIGAISDLQLMRVELILRRILAL